MLTTWGEPLYLRMPPVIVRRLVYEAYIGRRFLGGPLSENVKVVEVLSVLGHGQRDIRNLHGRVQDPGASSAIFDDDKTEVQVLEREDHSACTVFIRPKLPDPPRGLDQTSVFVSPPWRVEDGMGRVTLPGSAKEIRQLLRELEKTGIPTSSSPSTTQSSRRAPCSAS